MDRSTKQFPTRVAPRKRVGRLFTLAIALTPPSVGLADKLPIDKTTTPEQAAAHLLNRLGFGPAPGDIERVTRLGPARFIDEQLDPAAIPEPKALSDRLATFPEINLSATALLEHYTQNAKTIEDPQAQDEFKAEKQRFIQDLVEARLSRAVESPRQLQEVLTNFWFNHFNIGRSKPWVAHLFGNYEEQAIRPHILGRFRDLLGATAHHPAMLIYLDNDKSHAGPAANNDEVAPDGVNENYARELMELHTLGVNGGYSQADVIALARILSGWRVHRRGGNDGGRLGEFKFDEKAHDKGDKLFLGHRIASAGEAEGEEALDILARHPATAKHIAFKLAQYFIADAPDPAIVNRLAARFTETDGDLRAVLKTLFESPEFWAASDIGRKFKTPYEYIVSSLRATGAANVDYRRAQQAMAQLGMPLYGCVTPDGYKNTEAAWLSGEALSARIGFAISLTRDSAETPESAAMDVEKTLKGIASEDTLRVVAGETPPAKVALLLGGPDFMRR